MKLLIAFLFIFQMTVCLAQADDPGSNGGGAGTGVDLPGSGGNNGGGNSGSTPIAWPSELWDRFSNDLEDELDSQGAKLNASIFESLTDLELYKLGFGTNNSISINVQRKVYNNHDILDTYTVIDFMRVPLTIPIPIPLDDGFRIGGGNVGMSLGLNMSLNTTNIRQVLPKGLDKLPSLTELNQQATDVMALDDAVNNDQTTDENESDSNQPTSADVTDIDPAISDRPTPGGFILENLGQVLVWRSENPLTRARYKRIWNLMTHPFRLPFTEKAFERLDNGEIVSYALDGSIQLGGSVGWSGIEFAGVEGLSVGLSVSTYLHGGYKVSIMKESESQVQLKVSRRDGDGWAASIGVGAPEHEVFSGVMVLGSNVGRITEQVIPFNLSVNRPQAKSFDVGYRYDMTKEEAKKAYFKACFGRLKMSDELSLKEGSGVTKVFTREQRTQSENINYRMKLSLFLQRGHVTSQTTAQARITLGDDVHHIFRATNVNSRGYDTLWEDGEQRRYTFDTTISREDFDDSLDKGLALKIEGSMEDLYTTGAEAHEYMTELMVATGQTDLFPILPKFDPDVKCTDVGLTRWSTRNPRRNDPRGRVVDPCNNHRRQASYGKTRFFYRLGFTRAQLEKFINLPEERMWEVLAVAFGVKPERFSSAGARASSAFLNSYATLLNIPLNFIDLHLDRGSMVWEAKKFHEQWMKLKLINDPKEMTKIFAEMFHTRWHSQNFMKIMKLSLIGEDIAYYVSADARLLFGTISKQGKTVDDVDTISGRAAELIEFDRLGSRTNVDTSANVNNLSIKKLEKGKVEVSFDLSQEPKLVYVRVDRTTTWRSYKVLAKYIIKNTGFLKKGKNTFVVNKDGTDLLSKLFKRAIFNDQYNTLMMAINAKDASWGPVAAKRFRIRPPKEDEASLREELRRLREAERERQRLEHEEEQQERQEDEAQASLYDYEV
ncbi:MAG: hypothetical protein EP319_10815 [Deltaproteobacteria bacterium]|nr:MAG: hypothetical protein EP319_10815 [Deltaproteobacteria bacterium]